jgi:hypothetical protein
MSRFQLYSLFGYVVAEDQAVRVDQGRGADFEAVFKFIDLGNSQIAIQCFNGSYFCAEGGGGRELVANRSAAGPWETFASVDLGDANIALRANNGQYVRADPKKRILVADRSAIGPWETFSKVRPTEFLARANVTTAAVGGGTIVVDLDFGAGERLSFNGTMSGLVAGAGAGTAVMTMEPEELAALPSVSFYIVSVAVIFSVNWGTLGSIGKLDCGGFALPGGSGGNGTFEWG